MLKQIGAVSRTLLRGLLGRRRVAFAATAATFLAVSTAAFAAIVNIDTVDLTAAGGDATFDPDFDFAFTDGTSSGGNFYSPVDDGSTVGGRSDAFDGGLVLFVEDQAFAATKGNETGEQLAVGPKNVGGLKVTRTDRALPGSRTLRDLTKLSNPHKHAVTKTITLNSELGSDADTFVEGTSSGDKKFNKADRWGVTSDQDQTTSGDPPVTLVHYGKGAAVKTKRQFGPRSQTATVDGQDCVVPQFVVRIGGHQTRYLLFFAELSDAVSDSLTSAQKFNHRHLTPGLLSGLSKGVKAKILNWDL